MRYIARISILERHPDGANRTFDITRTVDENMTVADLMRWRKAKAHDPVNGEYASHEIILTPDDSEME